MKLDKKEFLDKGVCSQDIEFNTVSSIVGIAANIYIFKSLLKKDMVLP